MDLILDDDGGNNLVETKQGMLMKLLVGSVLPRAGVYVMEENRDVDVLNH